MPPCSHGRLHVYDHGPAAPPVRKAISVLHEPVDFWTSCSHHNDSRQASLKFRDGGPTPRGGISGGIRPHRTARRRAPVGRRMTLDSEACTGEGPARLEARVKRPCAALCAVRACCHWGARLTAGCPRNRAWPAARSRRHRPVCCESAGLPDTTGVCRGSPCLRPYSPDPTR